MVTQASSMNDELAQDRELTPVPSVSNDLNNNPAAIEAMFVAVAAAKEDLNGEPNSNKNSNKNNNKNSNYNSKTHTGNNKTNNKNHWINYIHNLIILIITIVSNNSPSGSGDNSVGNRFDRFKTKDSKS